MNSSTMFLLINNAVWLIVFHLAKHRWAKKAGGYYRHKIGEQKKTIEEIKKEAKNWKDICSQWQREVERLEALEFKRRSKTKIAVEGGAS